jgi:hypothetical protein
MRAVLPILIFDTPAVTPWRPIFVFGSRPYGDIMKGLETCQGVWGRVPAGVVSIVTHALLTRSCMRLALRAVEGRER